MIIQAFILIAGFALLISGAELLVSGASALARRFHVKELVIGLTIVAFGTSAPELVVNIFSSIKGTGDLTLGNISGSNIFNILFILGLSAIVLPLAVGNSTTWIEIPLCILSAAVLAVASNDFLLDGMNSPVISRSEGILLLFFFTIFMAYISRSMKSEPGIGDSGDKASPDEEKSLPVLAISIIAGLAFLVGGGKLIVDSAIKIASSMGVSERVIGLTIVAAGTSLPELATSLIAAFRKKTDIAIGNIVGSNIFNVFFILGTSAVIRPVGIQSTKTNADLGLNLGAGILLFLFVFTGKGRKIDRWEGIVMLLIYLIYLGVLISQG